jgi:tetratricopeptide (TPR) repeat protein
MLEKRGAWAAAEPLLEVLLRRVDRRDTTAALDLLMRLGRAAEAGGNSWRALRAYEDARAIAPGAAAPLRAAADVRFASEDWGEAARHYEELVRAHEASLGEALPDLYYRLGQAERGLENHDAAMSWFGKAVERNPNHQPAREALAERHLVKGDYAAWVRETRALVESAPEGDRAVLHELVGDTYRDRLGDPVQAIAAYRSALGAQPERRSVLEKLVVLYTGHKHWRAAVEALGKLAALEPTPTARAALLQRAALIERDELESHEKAAELLERALDDAPGLVEAFDALEAILTEGKQWKELARALRTALRRLPEGGEGDADRATRVRLSHRLGEVLRLHLDDLDGARAAYAVADALEPRNPGRQALLVELYALAGREHAEAAIALHQRLIAADPDRLPSYRALAQLYRDVGAEDKLWCVAATLCFLRKADDELRAVFEARRPDRTAVTERIPAELWRRLAHPAEDVLVGRLFALAGPFVALAAAEAHTVLGLRRAERVDPASDERPAARALARACHALGTTPPDLFFDGKEREALVLRNLREGATHTPALVVGTLEAKGQPSDLAELDFRVARAAALLRPETLLRGLAPPALLQNALESLLAIGGALPVPMDSLSEEIAALVPAELAGPLGEEARRLVAERGTSPSVTAWMGGVDLTSARIAFALTGDLAAAAQVIVNAPPDSSPLPAKRRLKDLVAFSVSEDYFDVRRALGVSR